MSKTKKQKSKRGSNPYRKPKLTGLHRAKRATGNRLDALLDKADGRLKTDYNKTTDAVELKRENLRLRRVIRRHEEKLKEWRIKLAKDRAKMIQELELYKELLEDKNDNNGE